MSNRARLAILTSSMIATLALSAPGPGPNDRSERLRSMPIEERIRLANKLKVFDALPGDEQAAIRALDNAIAAEPEENRANYYAILRRYHLWLRTLTDSQKAELASRPAETRLAFVTKTLAEQRAARKPEPLVYQLADFGGASPYELANLAKMWLKLTPQEQAEISKLPDPERRPRLVQLARKQGFFPVARPTREEVEAHYEKAAKSRQLPQVKKADEKIQEKMKQRLGEFAYLVDHPPAKVAPDKLLQFYRALPTWIRSGVEDVPPEEAEWLLTNLYRLIYRPGTEMVAAKPAADAAKKPAPGGAVPSSPTGAPPAQPQAPAASGKSSAKGPY
jgi:hypothetical protein